MFKKLTADVIPPKRQTRFSAGFDVFANEDKVIAAGQAEKAAKSILGNSHVEDEVEAA